MPVLDLKSDNLTTIEVEPHYCPLQQFILLTKEPIAEIFAKKYWELAELKNFWVGHFEFFLKFFFAYENKHGFHMRYRLFLYHVQNLRKDFIPTNMHTTVNNKKNCNLLHNPIFCSLYFGPYFFQGCRTTHVFKSSLTGLLWGLELFIFL